MSAIKYNGILLPMTKVNNLDYNVVYSEDGIDYMYDRIDLDITAVFSNDLPYRFSAGSTPGNPVGLNNKETLAGTWNDPFADIRAGLKNTLLVPRKTLTIDMGGLFDYSSYITKRGGGNIDPDKNFPPPADASKNSAWKDPKQNNLLTIDGPDVMGGPFPQSVAVSQIVAGNLLIVRFRIIAHFDRCINITVKNDDGTTEIKRSPGPKIQSHRYSQSMSYDSNFYCTRTTTGKLVISAGSVEDISRANASKFVSSMCPMLGPGFMRERIEMRLSADGLTLDYTIVDREHYITAPSPATSGSGSYREQISKLGMWLVSSISITLKAPPGVSKKLLIQKAGEICLSRISMANGDQIQSGEVAESLFDNEITLSMVALKVKAMNQLDATQFGTVAANAQKGKAFLAAGLVGTAQSGETLPPTDINSRTMLLQLIVQKWGGTDADVCLISSGSAQTDATFGIPTSGPANNVIDHDPFPPTTGNPLVPPFNNDHLASIFSDYAIDMKYSTKHHTLQFPVASKEDPKPVTGQPGFNPDGTEALVTFGTLSTVVQLCSPSQTVTVNYKASRIGKWPLLPSPSQDGSLVGIPKGYRLVRHDFKMETPELRGNLDYQYTIVGEMEVIIEKRIIEEQSTMSAGYQPFLKSMLPNTTTGDVVSALARMSVEKSAWKPDLLFQKLKLDNA